jgi:hypothetical protein
MDAFGLAPGDFGYQVSDLSFFVVSTWSLAGLPTVIARISIGPQSPSRGKARPPCLKNLVCGWRCRPLAKLLSQRLGYRRAVACASANGDCGNIRDTKLLGRLQVLMGRHFPDRDIACPLVNTDGFFAGSKNGPGDTRRSIGYNRRG